MKVPSFGSLSAVSLSVFSDSQVNPRTQAHLQDYYQRAVAHGLRGLEGGNGNLEAQGVFLADRVNNSATLPIVIGLEDPGVVLAEDEKKDVVECLTYVGDIFSAIGREWKRNPESKLVHVFCKKIQFDSQKRIFDLIDWVSRFLPSEVSRPMKEGLAYFEEMIRS